MTRWTALACALALLGCADEGSNAPEPPDTASLRATFAAPTGALDEAAVVTVLGSLEGRLQELTDVVSLLTLGTGAVDTLVGTVDTEQGLSAAPVELAPGLEQRGYGLSVEAGGWVELVRRCPGWGEPDGRGDIKLTAVVTSGAGFAETIWGAARGCLASRATDGARLRYDADIRLVLPDFDPSRLIVQITGRIGVDDAVRTYDFRARFSEGLMYLNQQLEGGESLLVGLDFQALGQAATVEDLLAGLTIQDRSGTWQCDLSGCDSPVGTIQW